MSEPTADSQPVQLRRTTCNRDCPDACAILATVEDGRITRLQGDPDHPVTQGFLCYRTGHFLETQYSPGRLTTPLYRESLDEPLRPIDWEQALGIAAARLSGIRAESGPAAIFHYHSGGTLGLLGSVIDYFFEQLGPVTVKRGDICSGAGDAAQELDFGLEDSSDIFDLYNSRNIILWGKNVWVSSPHLIPVLREARRRGATLTLIDPVWHRTASLCDRFIQPRPGSDFALAMAVAQVLKREGWTDPQAADYCDHLDDFWALAHRQPLEALCAAAEVTPAEVELLARRIGSETPTAILVGWGMGRRQNGAAIVRALDALGAVSGNLGVAGGGVSFYFKRRGAFDTSFVRGLAAAPRSICEPLLGRELLAAQDPPVRAVWITAGNPVAMLPDSATVAAALRSREFVVVVDSVATDTTDLAHLVLPCNTLLEADDLVGAYGHHYLGAVRPVVPPPPGVRSDLEIVQGLAARISPELAASVAGSPRDWQQRLIAGKLGPQGVTLAQIEAGGQRNPLAPPVLFADRRFPTASGRVNLIHQPPTEPAAADPDYPLLLMALSTEKSQSSQWTRPPQGLAQLTVHPDATPGLTAGTTVRVESAIGSLLVTLVHDPRQRRDVALMAKGGHLRDGRCANLLVSAATTDLGEGGALYDQRVRIVAASEPASG